MENATMEIKIVERGVDVEILILLEGIKFYSDLHFDTEREAETYLKEHHLEKGLYLL